MRTLAIVLALALPFALSGCKTVEHLTGKAGRSIDAVAPVADSRFTPAGDEVLAPALRHRRVLGFASLPVRPFDAYANTLLAEVAAAYPGQRVPARVILIPDSSYNGYSSPEGAIFLTSAFVESAESEDEIAALIAHEYAHIALGHHDKGMLGEVHKRLYGAGSLYLGLVAGQQKSSGPSVKSAKLWVANEAFRHLGQTALFPSWSRSQEAEADRLAFDLIVATGRSTEGLRTFLEKAAQADEAAAAGKAEELEKLKAEAEAGSVEAAEKSMKAAFSTLVAEISTTHESGEERMEAILAYRKEFYREHRNPPLRVGPVDRLRKDPSVRAALEATAVAADTGQHLNVGDRRKALQLAQRLQRGPYGEHPHFARLVAAAYEANGDRKRASAILETAAQRPDADFQVHWDRIQAMKESGASPELLLAALDRADRQLDEPKSLMPVRITALKQKGEKDRAQLVLARCLVAGEATLSERCHEAAK